MSKKILHSVISKVIYVASGVFLLYAYYVFIKQGCKWHDNVKNYQYGVDMFWLVLPMIVLPFKLFLQTAGSLEKWIASLSFSKSEFIIKDYEDNKLIYVKKI